MCSFQELILKISLSKRFQGNSSLTKLIHYIKNLFFHQKDNLFNHICLIMRLIVLLLKQSSRSTWEKVDIGKKMKWIWKYFFLSSFSFLRTEFFHVLARYIVTKEEENYLFRSVSEAWKLWDCVTRITFFVKNKFVKHSNKVLTFIWKFHLFTNFFIHSCEKFTL